MLTLPEGGKLKLEGFQKLILREAFEPGRRSLLILLPKGNGKTTLFAALAVFHLLTTQNARCYIGASDSDQAGIMYGFAQHFVEAHTWLDKRLLTRPSTKVIRSRRDLGFIKVMASDSSKGKAKRQGPPVTLALVDELHAHENDNLYTALRSGAFKRGGLTLTISTAGYDHESTLGQVRARMLAIEAEGGLLKTGLVVNGEGNPEQGDGRLTIARTKTANTAMLEWALRDGDDPNDPKVVKLASPASFVDEASIVDVMETPEITPWSFRRYFCNLWTLGFESWLPIGAWETLADPDATIEEGAEITAAIDMGRYRDCAALVWIDVETKVVKSRIWRSGGQDNPIPYGPVKDAIRELDETYRLTRMGYDPKYFDQAAEELEGEGIAMELFPQSNERMCPAAADLRKAIIDAEITHDGDSELTAHVIAAKAKDIGDDMFKLDKSAKNGPPIDGAEALSVAHRLALVSVSPLVPFEVIG